MIGMDRMGSRYEFILCHPCSISTSVSCVSTGMLVFRANPVNDSLWAGVLG
jgi:hypothetical protein